MLHTSDFFDIMQGYKNKYKGQRQRLRLARKQTLCPHFHSVCTHAHMPTCPYNLNCLAYYRFFVCANYNFFNTLIVQ